MKVELVITWFWQFFYRQFEIYDLSFCVDALTKIFLIFVAQHIGKQSRNLQIQRRIKNKDSTKLWDVPTMTFCGIYHFLWHLPFSKPTERRMHCTTKDGVTVLLTLTYLCFKTPSFCKGSYVSLILVCNHFK